MLALRLLGCVAAVVAAAAWAQGLAIDPRDPALYRTPARASTCRVCGEIRSIREVTVTPNRDAMNRPGGKEDPYVGGVGTQEMAERMGANTYEITIRMDNGDQQILNRRDGGNFRVGERVTVSGGIIAPL